MNSVGALALFVGVGILLFTGMYALDDLHSEINTTNDTEIAAQNQAAQAIENPIFMTMGYIILLIAAIALLTSFQHM